MSTTTMTTPIPLCRDQDFKEAMVQRIKQHIEDEVNDYVSSYDTTLEGDAYVDEVCAILGYLDENLLIYLK